MESRARRPRAPDRRQKSRIRSSGNACKMPKSESLPRHSGDDVHHRPRPAGQHTHRFKHCDQCPSQRRMEGFNCVGWRGSRSPATLGYPNDPTKLTAIATKPKGPPENWGLAGLLDVASALDLIKANTVAQARLATNFRNLIHPGRAQRTNEVCDKGTALTALAAAHLVVRDLS